MRNRTLDSGWQFRQLFEGPGYPQNHAGAPGWLDAVVPGHVHLDLERAGVIADPFCRMLEYSARWIDFERWEYQTVFEWSPDASLPRRVLRFEGLDTVCTVSLNGTEIAHHDNMFVPLEVDVSSSLVDGANTLSIVFESPIKVGAERRKAYFEKEGLAWDTAQFDERAFVRKIQCMSGWDWGPRLISAGIWKPVRLVEFASRITQLSVHQEPLGGKKHRVWVEAEVEGDGELSVTFMGQTKTGQDASFEVEGDLWWPSGMGEQTLYPLEATLGGHTIVKNVGLRTIKLLREADAVGESFTFEVNGVQVFARGANWIPNDSFPSRITRDDYWDQIAVCRDLNMNMLRVWGGGMYESEDFYDACDALGIMVWQDFPFGCSYYPDDEAAQAVIAAEAGYNIKRLRDRACLALWCGNNENHTMWEGKWGGLDKSPKRYYGLPIYEGTLPQVLAELDPQHSYIPSSPIGSAPEGKVTNEHAMGVNMGAYGDQHYWDVWHGRGDWIHYQDSTTRFSSEFGFASSCSLDLWDSTLLADDVADMPFPFPQADWHDKTGKTRVKFQSYVDIHYPRAETLEDWVYTSQLNQRDALRFGIEFYRRSSTCKGSLIWQFNDCWPVESWAVQDYLRHLKPAGFELERLYADVVVCFEKRGAGLDIWAVNDGQVETHQTLHLQAVDTLTGETKTDMVETMVLAPGERKVVATLDTSNFEASRTAVSVSLAPGAPRTRWCLLAEPKEMQFAQPTVEAVLTDVLEIRVKGFVADFVVWDSPWCPYQGEGSAGPGWDPVTGVDPVIRLEPGLDPDELRARCLAGRVDVHYGAEEVSAV